MRSCLVTVRKHYRNTYIYLLLHIRIDRTTHEGGGDVIPIYTFCALICITFLLVHTHVSACTFTFAHLLYHLTHTFLCLYLCLFLFICICILICILFLIVICILHGICISICIFAYICGCRRLKWHLCFNVFRCATGFE